MKTTDARLPKPPALLIFFIGGGRDIKGYRTVVDYDKLGLSVPVFINYKATKISHGQMLKMVDKMPEVVEWYGVTGPHCALLKLIVASTKELETVIEKLQEYGETSTSIILSSNATPKVVTKT